jgi:plastocyanin
MRARCFRFWFFGITATVALRISAGSVVRAEEVKPTMGSVEGVVSFSGEIPKRPVPDDAGVRRDLLQVDQKTHGLESVVVWLNGVKAAALSPTNNSALQPIMDQQGHEFVPHIIAVRSGREVKFTNSDAANHNVRTASSVPTNEFNVFTGMEGSYKRQFVADPQQRPVRVGCDIHPWMRGWVYVFDHPYFAVTDSQGRFHIASVPAGRYVLTIRQPDVGYADERTVTVEAAKATDVEIQLNAKDVRTREVSP